MLLGNAADDLVGYPHAHSDGFQSVANMWDCVIMSREVGQVCTGLIEEGYASKGFHVKAKSCNWGPAAGFIVEDPRFSKKGLAGAASNRQANLDTLQSYSEATTIPIFISDERVRWLLKHHKMSVEIQTPNRMRVRAAPGGGEPQPLTLEFVLVKERPPGAGHDLWGVYYGADASPELLRAGPDLHSQAAAGLFPVRAMTDPLNVTAKGYKRAQTGDYDLFAVFPRVRAQGGHIGYEHHGLDIRPADIGGTQGEDLHMGNITARLWIIRDNLNEAFRHAGYTGGDMVHHSDEAGRPFNPDLEPPFIGWFPGGKSSYGIQTKGDLKEFVGKARDEGFHIALNTSWVQELGAFGTVPAWKLGADFRRQMTPKSSPGLPTPRGGH